MYLFDVKLCVLKMIGFLHCIICAINFNVHLKKSLDCSVEQKEGLILFHHHRGKVVGRKETLFQQLYLYDDETKS